MSLAEIVSSSAYQKLYTGIHNRGDTATWRTLVVETNKLLGTPNPDFNPAASDTYSLALDLVTALTQDTYLEPLAPDVLAALSLPVIEQTEKILDYLLFNARHFQEPLLYNVADTLKNQGKSVAVVNVVGHYNDGETRIVAPNLIHPVEHLVILSSTQQKLGGSFGVLRKVLRTIRNPDFARHLRRVDVAIPMWAGSRGHRLGQSEKVGFEILETIEHAKSLGLTTRDILQQLKKELAGHTPTVRFFTIDIHNEDQPSQTFRDIGLEFHSLDPAPELAGAIYQEIDQKRLLHLPIRVVAPDKGAIKRTQSIATALLQHPQNKLHQVDIIYIDKTRLTAGIVATSNITAAERWTASGNNPNIESITPPSVASPFQPECILILSDDMADTCGTARTDMVTINRVHSRVVMKLFTATHPILSQGAEKLDSIGADLILLGNTLNPPGLTGKPNVHIVDLAPTLARALTQT